MRMPTKAAALAHSHGNRGNACSMQPDSVVFAHALPMAANF
jgi:hypothetical protein